jgi:hypothetical protein
VAGAGYASVAEARPKDWPDSFVLSTKAPISAFKPAKREWVLYLKLLLEMKQEMQAGKFWEGVWKNGPNGAPADTALQPPQPGCFENFLIWKTMRMNSVNEAVVWLDTVRKLIAQHPSVAVRESVRVFPSLIYLLAEEARQEAFFEQQANQVKAQN